MNTLLSYAIGVWIGVGLVACAALGKYLGTH